MNLNRVVIIGNLTADPEIFEVGKTKIVNASIAHHQFYEHGQEERQEVTTFVELKIWGSSAELSPGTPGVARKFSSRVRCGKIDGKMNRATSVRNST